MTVFFENYLLSLRSTGFLGVGLLFLSATLFVSGFLSHCFTSRQSAASMLVSAGWFCIVLIALFQTWSVLPVAGVTKTDPAQAHKYTILVLHTTEAVLSTVSFALLLTFAGLSVLRIKQHAGISQFIPNGIIFIALIALEGMRYLLRVAARI